MAESFLWRPAAQADGTFLADMVVEAANWRAGGTRPRHQVIDDPDHGRYLTGWMRPSDGGVVAVDPHGEPIGAAWFRLFPRTEPGFGYVGTGVPELIIGVRPIWRARGVGRMLLQRLVDEARARGHARLSLSVEHGNHAQALYRSEGFAVTTSAPTRDTMVRRLR